MELTQEYLKEIFDYKDGVLYWKIKPAVHINIGDRAGSLVINNQTKRKYYNVTVNYKTRIISRLIFLYHHGWLPKEVDHIDRNSLNNKIENLRPATRSQNCSNVTSHKNSSSQYLGVHFYTKNNVWISQICTPKKKYLGSFLSEEEAALAYNKAAVKYHGEFANLNIIKKQFITHGRIQ